MPDQQAEAPVGDRVDLFFRTGWMFATPDDYPALKELETVQRFRSRDGNWIFDVFADNLGLRCGCPGWRMRHTCRHVRWVLRWNFGKGDLGRFVTRLPSADDLRNKRGIGVTPAQWFDHHVAVVPSEVARLGEPSFPARPRRAASSLLPPSIRS